MGTGVGEAMLIGAAVGATAGGAGAAIQGGDPLKGALTGGAMGAVGGGLGAGFGAAGGTAAGGTSGATAGGAGGAAGGAAGGVGAGAGAAGGAGGGFYGGVGSTGMAGFTPGALSASGTSGFGAVGGAGMSGGAPGSLSLLGPGTIGVSAPTSGVLGSSTGIIGAAPTVAGYTPGMYASGAASMPGGVASLPGNFTGMAPSLSNARLATIGGTSLLGGLMQAERDQFGIPATEDYESTFDPSKFARSTPTYAPESVYRPQYRDYTTAAEGGIMKLAAGGMASGPVERMSMMDQQRGMYPQGMISQTQYATPTQRPASMEIVRSDYDTPVNPMTGIQPMGMAEGGIAGILEAAKAQGLTPEAYQNIYGRGNAIIEMEKRLKEGKPITMARGGISDLGGYSDGGRMLKGPGDGMSDSIPGVISGRQPARLADGEFVVPADVVSHLGNGSTDAGAKQLYSMMDKVRKARTGKKAQGKQINPRKYMPA